MDRYQFVANLSVHSNWLASTTSGGFETLAWLHLGSPLRASLCSLLGPLSLMLNLGLDVWALKALQPHLWPLNT